MIPADFVRLGSLPTLAEAECFAFELQDPIPLEGFVVKWKGRLYAYRNACPHTGVNLNWAPHQFFDIEFRFLQCGMHGALFEPDSGLCVHGPCLGQTLPSLDIRIENGEVYVKPIGA